MRQSSPSRVFSPVTGKHTNRSAFDDLTDLKSTYAHSRMVNSCALSCKDSVPFSEISGSSPPRPRKGPLSLDLSLTKSDVKSLRIKMRGQSSHRSTRRLDKKGRYMRDIIKQSECFEHYFTTDDQTEPTQS